MFFEVLIKASVKLSQNSFLKVFYERSHDQLLLQGVDNLLSLKSQQKCNEWASYSKYW